MMIIDRIRKKAGKKLLIKVRISEPVDYRKLGGISDNLIRISVGIDHPKDILTNLDQALDI